MDVSSYFETFLRALFAFFFLLLLTRILGKKQMSHLTYFNYIAGITIGTLSADVAVAPRSEAGHALLALVLWVALTIILGLIGMKSAKARVLLDGEPSILIRKGSVQEKSLKDLRLNLDDLMMMLRKANAFSLSTVEYAILEPNGQLSVMLKTDQQPAIRADLGIPAGPVRNLPTLLIIDGAVMEHEMSELGLSSEWLFGELKKNRITSVSDVLYAEYGQDGSVCIQRKGQDHAPA
ncbi:DUF421 domain-containing protein [Edaphobacillus lindanitolerans]|uniref:Uncharacterized membrane protein YcaP, DUF421 family n=1 Tax=Edaphobacillus lindanitolerans TaxID=550447 RepID=A0A1U7PPD7_9BACI|nr:DUF421 domain-containing protein [Edaphobacillus lindanitolerans]SIT80008.1 Uncharacterized membrane protein YcaP, DUF421 family [Edaphobacillus lindanitolerans]